MKKPAKRVRHVPQRTCVGCRQTLAKRTLIRIVHAENGVLVDPTGKIAGRGAYLHDRRDCWERALRGSLAHALKTKIEDHEREALLTFMAALPDDAEQAAAAPDETKGAAMSR